MPPIDAVAARQRFGTSPVARLATADGSGKPHLVPMTFALAPDENVVYSAVDAKPKSSRSLKRLANIAVNPAVSLLVDHYDADWQQLWWVRADGAAHVVDSGPEFDAALAGLAVKYPQYQQMRPAGPVVVIRVSRWRGWSAVG